MPRRSLLLAPAALVLTLAACSGDDGGDSTTVAPTQPAPPADGLVRSGLTRLPALELDTGYVITLGDLARANELAAVAPPVAHETDPRVISDWAFAVTGGSNDHVLVAVPLPDAANPGQLLRHAEFADELGWSIFDTDRFVELHTTIRLTVLEGAFDMDAIDTAVGPRSEGVWSVGDIDVPVDPDARSAARPLGEPLRMAERDGALAIARDARSVSIWLDGGFNAAADREHVAGVADALDARDVYAAMVLDGTALSATSVEAGVTPNVFLVLGAGLSVVDGQPVATFVYQHRTDTEAEANATMIEQLFNEGTSTVAGEPFAERFGSVAVSVEGPTVIVTAQLTDGTPPRLVWDMIRARDAIVTHA